MDIELAKKIRAASSGLDAYAETVSYGLDFAFAHPERAGVLRTLATVNAPVPLHVPRVGEGLVLHGFELVCTAVETEYRVEGGALHQFSTVTVDAPPSA